MLQVKLDLYLAAGIGAIVYWLGIWMVDHIRFFKKYCIPAPVVGGLVFALLNTIFAAAGVMQITFDGTLQDFFMLAFFTSVGFTVSFPLLKSGAKSILIILGLSIVMIFLQNFLGGGIASAFGLDPRLGVAAGSTALIGGPGTAAAFGKVMDQMGIEGGSTVGMTAAIFGLVFGSILGGPTATRRIRQYNLKSSETPEEADGDNEGEAFKSTSVKFVQGFMWLAIAYGLGTIVSKWLTDTTHITFPGYIGAMLVAVVIRNVLDASHKNFPAEEIDTLGNVFLNLFLAMAMMSLKLWQLVNLALPLIIILVAQIVLMFAFSYFVVFNVMGKTYNAAVQTAGFIGFAMGATSNAMANMQAITREYGPAREAYFVIPMVGGMFIDFFNATFITLFLNWWH